MIIIMNNNNNNNNNNNSSSSNNNKNNDNDIFIFIFNEDIQIARSVIYLYSRTILIIKLIILKIPTCNGNSHTIIKILGYLHKHTLYIHLQKIIIFMKSSF